MKKSNKLAGYWQGSTSSFNERRIMDPKRSYCGFSINGVNVCRQMGRALFLKGGNSIFCVADFFWPKDDVFPISKIKSAIGNYLLRWLLVPSGKEAGFRYSPLPPLRTARTTFTVYGSSNVLKFSVSDS